MKPKLILGTLMMVAPVLLLVAAGAPGMGGTAPGNGEFKVLPPISHGNLTIFPVVAGKTHDTSDFITLDEGIRSGEVVVTETGNMHTMVRRPPHQYRPPSGAQVNTLVLVNNSKRPLILLAGEIVTGGKQDRVVGKDRIVAPESDPVDLSVFCVEPGRWVESSTKFDTHAGVIAQPSIRKKVMEDKDQQKVWAEVRSQNSMMASAVAAPPPPARTAQTPATPGIVGGSTSETVEVTASAPTIETQNAQVTHSYDMSTFGGVGGSYAKVRENKQVESKVKAIADPVDKSFESVIKQLRDQNAVGVVVAVKGHIVWADIFASKELLTKYWPKLLQSYAAEAFSATGVSANADVKEAQEFVDNWSTKHEVVDSEPGLYRETEMTGDRFRAFELTSLLPKQIFDLHLSKMAE